MILTVSLFRGGKWGKNTYPFFFYNINLYALVVLNKKEKNLRLYNIKPSPGVDGEIGIERGMRKNDNRKSPGCKYEMAAACCWCGRPLFLPVDAWHRRATTRQKILS